MFTYTNPATVVEQAAVMRYSGTPQTIMPNGTVPTLNGVTQDLDSSALVPVVKVTPPAATHTEMVYVSFQFTSDGKWGGFFNDSAWAPETGGNATVFQTAEGAFTGSAWSSSSQFTITNNDIQVFDLVINK